MTTIHVTDANTGDIVAIDTTNPTGNLYVVDANTGNRILVDLSSPFGTINVIDSDTGDIISLNLASLSGIVTLIDANTGNFVDVDLGNPTGLFYTRDEDTGNLVQIDLSVDAFFKAGDLVIPKLIEAPQYEIPSYNNLGGRGDRTSIVTATTGGGLGGGVWAVGNPTQLINGNLSGEGWFGDHAEGGIYIRFQFSAQVIITEAKWYQDSSDPQGVWKWQGSNNAINWTDIGGNFTLNGTPTGTAITTLAGNETPYTYYQIAKVSGATNPSVYQIECEFKIANPL